MLEIALKIVVTLVLLIPLAGSLYGITWLWCETSTSLRRFHFRE